MPKGLKLLALKFMNAIWRNICNSIQYKKHKPEASFKMSLKLFIPYIMLVSIRNKYDQIILLKLENIGNLKVSYILKIIQKEMELNLNFYGILAIKLLKHILRIILLINNFNA
jgi:hypothetical protein